MHISSSGHKIRSCLMAKSQSTLNSASNTSKKFGKHSKFAHFFQKKSLHFGQFVRILANYGPELSRTDHGSWPNGGIFKIPMVKLQFCVGAIGKIKKSAGEIKNHDASPFFTEKLPFLPISGRFSPKLVRRHGFCPHLHFFLNFPQPQRRSTI